MKLHDITVEAKRPVSAGELEKLILTALDELGIKLKFGRVIDWPDELVKQAVGMMKDAKGDPSKGSYASVISGLSEVAFGLKGLPDKDLSGFVRGMAKLQTLPHFMHADLNLQHQRQALAMLDHKQSLLPLVEHLTHISQAIINIINVAKNSPDDYKKSVATAVVKKLGLSTED